MGGGGGRERGGRRERERGGEEGGRDRGGEKGEGGDWGKGGSMLQPQTDRQRAIQRERESFKTVTGASKMTGQKNDEGHCTSCEYANRTRP